VYRGLTARPKTLSPWLFYDVQGSQLFEEITELDEYYVTRTERSIFLQHGEDILRAAAESSQHLSVIELGAGTATKTGILLSAAVRQQGRVVYHAIDVSGSALEAAKQNLEEKIPGIMVETRTGDYTDGLGAIDAGGTRRLVLYIGSSIGNFDPAAAMDLLRGVRAQIAPGDRLLLGVDMVKDLPTLLAAYDDARGVTAAFNRNVLLRINRELGANFHPQCFRHKVRWNGELSRIEMHLESLIRQTVEIQDLNLSVAFRRGETIHTENSYKYTQERLVQMLRKTGFRIQERWMDARKWFSVVLAEAV
jgi:dimethylhistidine N-methyltransferase